MNKFFRSVLSAILIITLLGLTQLTFATGSVSAVSTNIIYVSAVLSGTKSGATVIVNNETAIFGTNAFDTIQAAVNVCKPNNTIRILQGTYTEAVTLDKPLNVQILGDIAFTQVFSVQSPAVIEGVANAQGVYPTIDLKWLSSKTCGICIQSDDVTLKNLNIINSTQYTIKPQAKNVGVNLRNLKFENLNIFNSAKTGLELYCVNNVTIKGVTVKNTVVGSGISLTDSNDIVFDNVVTQNNAWGGIAIYIDAYSKTPGCDGLSFINMTPANQIETVPIYSQQIAPFTIKNIDLDGLYTYKVIVSATNNATDKNEVITAYFETLSGAKAYATLYNSPYILAYSAINTEIQKPTPVSTPTPETTLSPTATPASTQNTTNTSTHISFDYAYLYGYENGNVGAEDPIKREEASALLYRLLKQNNKLGNFTKPSQPTFSDVPTNRWSFSAIEFMTSINVFDRTMQKVSPGAEISRGEASNIIASAMKLKPDDSKKNNFTDLKTDNIYYSSIKALVDEGILKGYTDNTIGSNKLLTRAEYVTMINRLIGRDSSYYIDNQVNLYPDFSKSHWAYKEIMRASLGFSYDGISAYKVDAAKRLKRSEIDYN